MQWTLGIMFCLQAQKQLAGFPKDKKKYEALLTDLLVQAVAKLKQPAVIVKGREVSSTSGRYPPAFPVAVAPAQV